MSVLSSRARFQEDGKLSADKFYPLRYPACDLSFASDFELFPRFRSALTSLDMDVEDSSLTSHFSQTPFRPTPWSYAPPDAGLERLRHHLESKEILFRVLWLILGYSPNDISP